MLKVYNSLTREIEEFAPIEEGKVRMYTCGPTVYDYVTIGNWRTYTLGDLVYRTMGYLGYEAKYIMNITDVGHLTGDNLGDSSQGEDRLEKGAKREGKTAWEIAEFYTQDFLNGFNSLNLLQPLQFTKATAHIAEQIDLVQKLEQKGLAYKISDGIYFDVTKFESEGNNYGELSNIGKEAKEGARVEPNPEKKDHRDFALWKFSPEGEERQMEWDSPWGKGFPGWHIECSAMAMKYLGEQFDLHLGGEDLRATHHPNEIAQSEGATGHKPFVSYWMHGAFLKVDGGRMGKSLGNAYTLHDIEKKGFSPFHLRYFYLTAHYRSPLNFTWESLTAAKNAYENLVEKLKFLASHIEQGNPLPTVTDQVSIEKFKAALENDLNIPEALAVMWEVLKLDVGNEIKLATVLEMDKVFGLGLETQLFNPHTVEIPAEAQKLIEERNQARAEKDWDKADALRAQLKDQFGIEVKDSN